MQPAQRIVLTFLCCVSLAVAAYGAVPDRTPIRDPTRRTSTHVYNYVELRNRNIVMQRRDYSCGAACLATLVRYYWGDKVTEDLFLRALDELLTTEEIEDRIENGLAMSDLRRAAVKVGYHAVVGKISLYKLQEAKVPLIVGVSPEGHDHFVVFRGLDGDWAYLADPIRGNIRIPIGEFADQWQENAVLAIHKPGYKVREISPLSLQWDEVRRGELNRHVIRTQPQRQPARPDQLP